MEKKLLSKSFGGWERQWMAKGERGEGIDRHAKSLHRGGRTKSPSPDQLPQLSGDSRPHTSITGTKAKVGNADRKQSISMGIPNWLFEFDANFKSRHFRMDDPANSWRQHSLSNVPRLEARFSPAFKSSIDLVAWGGFFCQHCDPKVGEVWHKHKLIIQGRRLLMVSLGHTSWSREKLF